MDTYDVFAAAVTYGYSNTAIRASSSFQWAEAIREAILTARLFGMVFSTCGGGVQYIIGIIDTERARELLNTRAYA